MIELEEEAIRAEEGAGPVPATPSRRGSAPEVQGADSLTIAEGAEVFYIFYGRLSYVSFFSFFFHFLELIFWIYVV